MVSNRQPPQHNRTDGIHADDGGRGDHGSGGLALAQAPLAAAVAAAAAAVAQLLQCCRNADAAKPGAARSTDRPSVTQQRAGAGVAATQRGVHFRAPLLLQGEPKFVVLSTPPFLRTG